MRSRKRFKRGPGGSSGKRSSWTNAKREGRCAGWRRRPCLRWSSTDQRPGAPGTVRDHHRLIGLLVGEKGAQAMFVVRVGARRTSRGLIQHVTADGRHPTTRTVEDYIGKLQAQLERDRTHMAVRARKQRSR